MIQAQRLILYCARGSGERGELRETWRSSKRAYFEHRARKLANRRYLDAITPPGAVVLAAIRSCESGGDYSINTGNGFYGAYQFTASTWLSVGGSGLASEASPHEQDERAARLYREQGSSPWPVCGV
ncbi:MAG TPA: transglycosylase family protein [Solirubrobacterales bacterium]|nr:transglycosylase family protein [Solirubrobacterales bacterium]